MSQLITAMLAAGIACYALSWLLFLSGKRRIAGACWVTGWVVNLAILIANWVVAGEPPFGNMYHVLILLALCFLPLNRLPAYRDRLTGTEVYFAFTSAFAMAGPLFMDRDLHWQRVPALQSPWFVPHVFTYMVSYALAAVAFVMTVTGFARNRLPARTHAAIDYPSASYRILLLAFPFMTFGMLSGALWAEEAWGAYWSWDPKEVWALITWTLYVVYFHCRKDVRTRRYADLAQALAFAALLTTFFLVNLLPKLASPLHSYS